MITDQKIAENLDHIAKAYNIKDKTLYKQCIYALELDLMEYECTHKTRHPMTDQVIKLYEKLWELQ